MGNDSTSSPFSTAAVENLRDYTFMWWASGWREGKTRCVQTSCYGLVMDVERVTVTHFGALSDPLPYEQAVSQPNDAVFALPPAALELTVRTSAGEYSCTVGGHPRLIESGRYLQRAIGSWGESICYDPDVCLQRSMIDDVRPLMVTQMGTENGRWGWTNNVGGGDFLVYFDQDGTRRFLSRMRTAYLSQGPNLTDVVYAGISDDGKIAATVRVMTPRGDDINRAYHFFRYDVLAPTRFERLAFYQVGADRYNDHQFRKMARGDENSLIEEWEAPQGGLRYHRVDIPCPGKAPWFSLHEGVGKDAKGGAWANRGLVIRSWNARIDGKETPPIAACYGTENGPPSCNIELTPPSRVTELQPGDFVEAWVELLVLPQSADDDYGPNEALRKDLRANANTWRPVFRQAAGNALQVTAIEGTLRRPYPPCVEVGPMHAAEITIAGGVGYIPLTFTGLDDYRGWELCRKNQQGAWEAVDQSVFGNDFWQIDREEAGGYAITFNVSLDAQDGADSVRRFLLRKK